MKENSLCNSISLYNQEAYDNKPNSLLLQSVTCHALKEATYLKQFINPLKE